MKETLEEKIHAYCTVDPSYLERVGEQIICRKCSREMADLDAENGGKSTSSSGRSKQLICGVVSAAALSSCGTIGETGGDDSKFLLGLPPKKEEVPLPGVYYGKKKAPLESEGVKYPEAKHIDGKPGTVESPYGGHPVDVSRIPPGSLVIDPKFGAESDKFFRI